jgi:hypothetical protein
MTTVSFQWYNENAGRDYPVDESSTATDDQGLRLAQNIIVDLRLSYPKQLGVYPFISAVSVTEHAISVCLQASQVGGNIAGFSTSLATLTVLKSQLIVGRPYQLQGTLPGVAGYVVFGEGTRSLCRHTFSTPRQGGLTPRSFRAYDPLPVWSLGKLYEAAALTDIVTLRGESPVELVAEERNDGERDVTAIVVRLSGQTFDMFAEQDPTLLSQYIGPCGKRPDSRTCGDPQPIEYLNAVSPDCDGVIDVELNGCAVAGVSSDGHMLIIDCALGLDDTCAPVNLPGPQGQLISEGGTVTPWESPSYDSQSIDLNYDDNILGTFPYVETFDGLTADDFVIVNGEFTFTADSMSSGFSYSTETANGTSQRNVAVWSGFDVTTLERRIITDVKLLEGDIGDKHSAGLVLNYRPHGQNPSLYVYFTVELDYDSQSLLIRKFTGSRFVVIEKLSIPGLALNRWYRLMAEVMLDPLRVMVLLRVRLVSLEDGLFNILFGPMVMPNYAPVDGRLGLGTDRSLARFDTFQVELLA